MTHAPSIFNQTTNSSIPDASTTPKRKTLLDVLDEMVGKKINFQRLGVDKCISGRVLLEVGEDYILTHTEDGLGVHTPIDKIIAVKLYMEP